jgi:hypothetical protein
MKIYRTIILSVALYGSETWFHTLSVTENRVVRAYLDPKGGGGGRLERSDK